MNVIPITFTITSCCRPDLLERTLRSFMKNNNYPIVEYLLIDDGDLKNPDIQKVKEIAQFYGLEYLIEGHIGRLECIDRIYSEVKTEMVFHCEDDWEFFNGGGFIQQSLDIITEYPEIGLVWLRRDDMPHPVYPEVHKTISGTEFQYPVEGWKFGYDNQYFADGWFGFTFNPGVRRKSDYLKIAPLKQYGYEKLCNIAFHEAEIKVATLTKSYCRHMGEGRSVINILKAVDEYRDGTFGEIKELRSKIQELLNKTDKEKIRCIHFGTEAELKIMIKNDKK